MTKTCLQCGAVLPSSVSSCRFCDDASLSVDSSNSASYCGEAQEASPSRYTRQKNSEPAISGNDENAWRDELNNRVQAYRTRRRKSSPQEQSHLPFEECSPARNEARSVAVDNSAANGVPDDFAFTIAIGRPSPKRVQENARMVIDVSLPVDGESSDAAAGDGDAGTRLHRAALLDDRRIAALIDAGCLLFAYGAFLALFGSLGGQLTFSKISTAVYFTTFAFVYIQYFGLFTVFGGTTPGMMARNLQIINFSGETPTPRQLFLRTAGYLLSAGAFFLGFLWAMWDEDELTWHDRLSHTYLSPVESFVDMEASAATRST